MSHLVAAVDLGATSGRIILGEMNNGVLKTHLIKRFGNEPVTLNNGLHWNIAGLYQNILAGLKQAETEAGPVTSLAVSSWGVDYGLMNNGKLVGLPHHYRDARNDAAAEKVHEKISPVELYERNGLQYLPFNTMFQLTADGDFLYFADQMLMIPDLLNFWLTGIYAAEKSNASTTGLLNARTRKWDFELADRLSIPENILPELVDSGTELGVLSGHNAQLVGRPLTVMNVKSHDTASAIAAVPNNERDFAYISCGTWGLVGLEVDQPVLTESARLANFTNEAGIASRTNFLRNIMGLWLLSESQRTWQPDANLSERSAELKRLLAKAAQIAKPVGVFDANDPIFMPPGDMPARIQQWCREHAQPVPETKPEIVRSIVESIALAFAKAVQEAAAIAGKNITSINIVGGGAQNALLCQAVANRANLPVLAGPVEATAMGNILVQLQTLGEIPPGVHEIRQVVANTSPIVQYYPE